MQQHALAEALARELAGALGAAVGEDVAVAPGTAAAGAVWRIPLTLSGALKGEVAALVDATGAATVAKRLMGSEDDPEPDVVRDMLAEMLGQAASAVALTAPFIGLSVAIGRPAPGTGASGPGLALSLAGTVLATVTFDGQIAAPPAAAAAPPPAEGALPDNLAVLMDIDLPLVARFSRTELTLRALTELGPGSMVDMGRAPEDPVDLLVGGHVVAQGEVVVVGGNYGVRVTALVSPADRLRALEG